ncbi:MAG: hypothetical protein IKE75_00460 [Bacilli bacterium]|nr:hypothetical protein [Bacilli bacterium]
MENKSTGKTVAIIILLLAVLGLGGYIIYDKVLNKENTETTGKSKIENITTENTMSKEEALEIGKENYEYIRNGLYMCGYKQLTLSQEGIEGNKINAQVSNGITDFYHEILNIDSVKNKLSTNVFDKYVSDKLVNFQNKYYLIDGCGGDPRYAYDKYQIEVKDIQENAIIYNIIEYFYAVEGIEPNINISEDLNKAEKYTTTFKIEKQNNEWKISQYEDAYSSYIAKHNNQ